MLLSKLNHGVVTICFQSSDCTHYTPPPQKKTSSAFTVDSPRYEKLPRVWQRCFINCPGALPFIISQQPFIISQQPFWNHLMQKALSWSFMLIAPSPPSTGALHKLFILIFSNAFLLVRFFFHRNESIILSIVLKRFSESKRFYNIINFW